MSLPTVFTFLFAAACLATFVSAARKQWKGARIISAVIAIMSFLMALVSASITK